MAILEIHPEEFTKQRQRFPELSESNFYIEVYLCIQKMSLFFNKHDYVKKEEFNEDSRNLQDKLRRAFSKIKNNFYEVYKSDEKLKHGMDLMNLKLESIEKQLSLLQQQAISQQSIEDLPKEEDEEELTLFQDLTHTQLSLVGTMLKLKMITKQDWIPVKSIAKEYYPDHDYNNVKGILSQYTEILLELGLIKKKRYGMLMNVSFTKKGEKFVKEHSKELLEIIKKIKSNQGD